MGSPNKAGSMVLAVAGLGDLIVFQDGVRILALSNALDHHFVWPQTEVLSADDFQASHAPLADGPLALESIRAEPLTSLRDTLVVLDLDTPLFTPRYRAPGATRPFLVPDYAWQHWSAEQITWLRSHCTRDDFEPIERVKANAEQLVMALVANNNVVVMAESFEFAGSPLSKLSPSNQRLASDLEELNTWLRKLSGDFGALLLHAHAGMSYEGAAALETDCRKRGEPTADVLLEELRLTLEEGGGLDVFIG